MNFYLKQIILSLSILAIVFVVFILSYKNMNFLHYLALMITPIIVNTILAVILKRKNNDVKKLPITLTGTSLYAVFLLVALLVMDNMNALQLIHENSIGLFSEGFSIGNDSSFALIDMVLPLAICFITYYLALQLFGDLKRK